MAPDDEGRARFLLETRRATQRLARALAAILQVGDLLVLTGDLGMGKTFLTRAICRASGVPHEIPVTSPSFALVNEYEGQLPILHVDLYRLGNAEEVAQLGLRQRRADSLLIVEWGLDYVAELGGQALIVDLSLDDRERRLATLWDESAPELLRRAVAALT